MSGVVLMRKAQLKLTENVAVLFVFFLLLVFGMIFYMGVMKSTAEKDKDKNFVLKAIKTVQLITFMPEMQCSAENIVTDACFDRMKVNAFTDLVDTNFNYYFDFFGYANISVNEIYPSNTTWHIYNNLPDDHIKRNKLATYVPISLYNATAGGSRGYSFGVLKVVVYEN